jgi:apolipoprotein N-acyltransferase
MYDVSVKTYFVAIILESLIFSLPFCFMLMNKKMGVIGKWMFFSFIWILMEYMNQKWSIGTPYFILGSGLGQQPWLIQSYEFIGVEGGSVFILLFNLSIYSIIERIRAKSNYLKGYVLLGITASPFIISLFMQLSYNNAKKDRLNIAVLHTNFEAYSSENNLHPENVTKQLLNLSIAGSSGKEEMIVWPETIISNCGWLTNQQADTTFKILSDFYKNKKPTFALCIGGYAFSVNYFGEEDPYAQFEPNRRFYYNTHNVALTYVDSTLPKVRSKEIFVPFQERIPYLKKMPFMMYLADVVGANTKVSYYEDGTEIHETMLKNKFIPILCYESIFPLYLSKKAEDIHFYSILANEYWNKNIQGSEQYLYTNVGIAIQSRIPIIRSSNGGVSAIIDKNGQIVATKKGKAQGLLHGNVVKKTEKTFYDSIHGIFYGIAAFGGISIFLLALFQKIFQEK